MALTQKQIGQRIIELRKAKGLSQEDLAKRIKISRPSLAQIELGNRGVDILELQRLSLILEFSMDAFLSSDFPLVKTIIPPDYQLVKKQRSVTAPVLQVEKLRNVMLYILERCAGKPNVGETVLFKLLYFADFNYYELYEEHFTGARYRKLPYGPVPQKLNDVIEHMIRNGQIQRIKTGYHGYPQTRYIPLMKPDLTRLKASEKEVLDKVIEQMSDWSAAAVSRYSHHDIPWLGTPHGEEIDYELAFYREAPFSVRNYGDGPEENEL